MSLFKSTSPNELRRLEAKRSARALKFAGLKPKALRALRKQLVKAPAHVVFHQRFGV